ncbi:MAG: HEAT repeat domain-containing protein [Planctomycetes bacterium]|nr:HEAT repeat domain-containing protein [Planctomycetota bacterium]
MARNVARNTSVESVPSVSNGRAARLRGATRWGAALVAVALLVAAGARGVRAWTIHTSVERLDSPDRALRDTSEQRLRLLDDSAPLVAALRHERAEVRRSMVWIVASRGAGAVSALAPSIDDADASVRVAVCGALGPLPGAEVDAALARATRDPDADVRRAATSALATRASTPDDDRAAWRVAALRAVRWLWSRQSADGGWHGESYGVFEDGRSVTPFVLLTLLDIPSDLHAAETDGVRRAFDFMAANPPEGSAFSTYATSLALRCVVGARPEGWQARAAAHVDWLRRAQFAEPVGCPPEDLAYGAWGLDAARRGLFARADLSATCFALRALVAAGVPSSDETFRRASIFVDRCRSAAGDGGFFLSTNSPAANKAGTCGEAEFRSYGSATADGVLTLAALSRGPDVAGIRWLAANPEAMRTPGFAKDDPSGWNLGVMYYYAAERSLLRDDLRRADDGPARAWENSTRRMLIERQRADGSWANDVSLMREDEPLVATGFALQTLVRLGAPRSGEPSTVNEEEVR